MTRGGGGLWRVQGTDTPRGSAVAAREVYRQPPEHDDGDAPSPPQWDAPPSIPRTTGGVGVTVVPCTDSPRPTYRCGTCGAVRAKRKRPDAVTYLAQRDAFVKVGVTTQYPRRLRALVREDPKVLVPAGMDSRTPLVVLRTFPFDYEHECHEAWAGHHEIGEWFRLEGWVAAFVDASAWPSAQRPIVTTSGVTTR